MSRSAMAAGVAAVATILALCLPGTALARTGPHRDNGHNVYTCVRVRDRALNDTGRICINAFMNPYDREFHYRAMASFRSIRGGKLSKVSATTLFLRLGRRKHGIRHDPKASARRGATSFRMMTAWIADPRDLNPLAVVENACMTWRNGGRACRRGYFRGGLVGYIS